MSAIPAFHFRAAEEAADRMKAAQGERDRAADFLSDLDELLEDFPENEADSAA